MAKRRKITPEQALAADMGDTPLVAAIKRAACDLIDQIRAVPADPDTASGPARAKLKDSAVRSAEKAAVLALTAAGTRA